MTRPAERWDFQWRRDHGLRYLDMTLTVGPMQTTRTLSPGTLYALSKGSWGGEAIARTAVLGMRARIDAAEVDAMAAISAAILGVMADNIGDWAGTRIYCEGWITPRDLARAALYAPRETGR